MTRQDLQKVGLPDVPGVYLFKKGQTILYIGRATSLKDRVKSYFAKDLIVTRGPLIVDMVFEADRLDFQATDSVLEAIILEAELIRTHTPKYNTKEKDDKSNYYVVITDEDYPRVLLERGKNLDKEKMISSHGPVKYFFGPFLQASVLKEALKIVRKIFPYRDSCKLGSRRPCFNYSLGLCPGVCAGLMAAEDYEKTIDNLRLLFAGKKKSILINLNREMERLVTSQEFERAKLVRNQIYGLEHIQDIALIRDEDSQTDTTFRVEAYDVAHISGTNTVGVMVVWENGAIKKSDYRKFKLARPESIQNDIASLKEILERRLAHTEWPAADMIVVDGGRAQISLARKVVKSLNLKTKVVSVVKGKGHKPKAIMGDASIARVYEKVILLANSEAHRFAITYHRKLRSKF